MVEEMLGEIMGWRVYKEVSVSPCKGMVEIFELEARNPKGFASKSAPRAGKQKSNITRPPRGPRGRPGILTFEAEGPQRDSKPVLAPVSPTTFLFLHMQEVPSGGHFLSTKKKAAAT